jgi:hypothetical protein
LQDPAFGARNLSGGTADEEPLVDGRIDLLRGKVLVRGQRGKLLGGDTAGGVGDGDVGTRMEVSEIVRASAEGSGLRRDTTGLGLAGDQTLPSLGALTDDIHGVPATLLAPWSISLEQHSTDFLFLHSPVKANWFSGLPSGIL